MVHLRLLVTFKAALDFQMTSECEVVVELLAQLCLLDLEEYFIQESKEPILTKV